MPWDMDRLETPALNVASRTARLRLTTRPLGPAKQEGGPSGCHRCSGRGRGVRTARGQVPAYVSGCRSRRPRGRRSRRSSYPVAKRAGGTLAQFALSDSAAWAQCTVRLAFLAGRDWWFVRAGRRAVADPPSAGSAPPGRCAAPSSSSRRRPSPPAPLDAVRVTRIVAASGRVSCGSSRACKSTLLGPRSRYRSENRV